ncbi:MAG TPA: Bax inhibitor-1/YccA family protein [Bdellovibrio sp.]|nr:Bax inhibitor-1/YccA family protein [Bdellovibrio sp.]
MGNPAFSEKALKRIGSLAGADVDKMTVQGAINRTGILLAILALGAGLGWNLESPILLFGSLIGALILSFVIIFNPPRAAYLSQVYAFLEGILLGSISSFYDVKYTGIVGNALMLTVGILGLMLALYHFKVIRVTDRFKSVLISVAGAIAIVYFIDIVMSFFGVSVPMIHQGGMYGIGFSLLVTAVAAFNLLLDFDMIEKSNEAGAPKFMEWYGAFALLVTLIWLYLEILRLLSKRK